MYFGHSRLSGTVAGVVAPEVTFAFFTVALATNAGFRASPKHITVTVRGPVYVLPPRFATVTASCCATGPSAGRDSNASRTSSAGAFDFAGAGVLRTLKENV